MLRLYDSGSGRVQTIEPGRAGELRTWVGGPATAGPAGLRAAVVGDLVRRAAERHRLRVSAWHQAPGAAGDAAAEQAVRAAWAELNIHPAEFSGRPPEPLDVAIAARGDRAAPAARYRVEPGQVTGVTGEGASLDPLALRLALLMVHYREPAEVTKDILELAGRTLAALRRQVAGWARSPSAPMGAQHVGDVLGAFDTDLDTPAALLALAALADDPQVPPGSKFEAFAYLDQMFGLDLARDVGK